MMGDMRWIDSWARPQLIGALMMIMVLLVIIAVLLFLWPHNTMPDHIVVRIVEPGLDGTPKVYSTQVVPLR